MTTSLIKNIGASVRQRLLNQAKFTKRPFTEMLQYYAMERFLYRLSVSPHADKFLLKSALLLSAWKAPISRLTRDIDLLGRIDNSVDGIVQIMRETGQLDVIDDGMNFVLDSFSGTTIREDADYSGVRISFTGLLNGARVPMQIDIGFGDVITPAPELITYPTILPCLYSFGIQPRNGHRGKAPGARTSADAEYPYEELFRSLDVVPSARG